MVSPKHLRGGDSARRYGREPKVHYARNSYENDSASLCERSLYGRETDDPVNCKLCLEMSTGYRRIP